MAASLYRVGPLLVLLVGLSCGGGMDRVDQLLVERLRAVEKGTLMIPSARLTDAELEAVLSDPRVPALQELTLHHNQLTADGVTTITTSPKLAGLSTLDVSNNPVGDEGLSILAVSPVLDPLRVLSLAAVGASAEGVRALTQGAHVDGVAEIDLGFQALGDAGAQALASWPPRDKLLLQKAGIGGPGARALLEQGQAATLKLKENPVGEGGLTGLSQISPALVTLDASACGLGPADAAALAGAAAPGLRSLELDHNALGDAGLRALASAPWLGQLQFLSVMGGKASPAARSDLQRAWGQRPGLTIEK
jgi:hypothetical protein